MWLFSRKGPSGFSASSTAEEVTQGIDGTGLTAIVTGASSGIGTETARVLALRGVHVIMAVRNMAAGKDVREAIVKEIPSAKVDAMELDVSSLASVRKFASEYNSQGRPLNILINNAGIMASPFMLSKDNIELQFATNHLGHFLLTHLLLDTMKKTAQKSSREGRIVNVSSEAHRFAYSEGIRFDKINDESAYNSFGAYGQSKLANILHAKELAKHLKEDGVNITANSLHPGSIVTNLFRYNGILRGFCNTVGKLVLKNIPQGAATTCYVALHPQVQGVSGDRTSEYSLLPRLATWQKSEDVADKIMYIIECEMRRCRYTLGLGEPNLAGKPNLEYDVVCKPNELHSLKKNPYDHQINNHENQTLYTAHQILESWIFTTQQLLKRIVSRIESKQFEEASNDCYLLERIWKLLSEIEDLHLLMDPDDFLRLKNQLSISSSSESGPFCFRSRGLFEITKQSKELKHNVPLILGVEVDPRGGPRVQEAAMRMYNEKKERDFAKIHLVQALQAVEAALKRFFYAYKQLLAVVMGSLEAKANGVVVVSGASSDSLSQLFLEPTYYPSLDAAKTFLGEFWSHEIEKKH